MRFGICGNTSIAAVAARESYDFAEWTVPALLKPRESEDAFCAALNDLRAARLRYPVANCFVPGDLKITGPEVDNSALQAYVRTTMERAERAGIEVIVFGSGGARRIPDGFDPRVAKEQIIAFCRMVAPLAHDHGITVVVEPLNTAECNVLTTVDECAKLVNEVAHPAIRLLVDAYHLMLDGDSYDDIVTHGDLLAHVHIATVPGRLAPGAEPCDFSRFFSALANASYAGRISIEGNITDPVTELHIALTVMREWAAAVIDNDSNKPRRGE
jgi:sugar phosphate isomerase/epimerase